MSSLPPRPPRLPQVGDTLQVYYPHLSYEAPVDRLTGQYVHVAQLRFHVLDDWINSRAGWIAQPGDVLVALPETRV